MITEIGTIYITCVQDYEFLNATHANRIDNLYKIDMDGESLWSLSFEKVVERNARALIDASEYYDRTLYFNYYDKLYKIDPVKGKIEWVSQQEYNIQGLVAFGDEVCIASYDQTKNPHLFLTYFDSNKAEKWEKAFTSHLGVLELKSIELKQDKIGLNILDTVDGETTGEAFETYSIISTRGEELVEKQWNSSIYFLHRRKFSLLYSDGYYV
ncbi:hypothetical protein EU534_01410, partial [Candidatus Heimdallarchaeota archaeon]